MSHFFRLYELIVLLLMTDSIKLLLLGKKYWKLIIFCFLINDGILNNLKKCFDIDFMLNNI